MCSINTSCDTNSIRSNQSINSLVQLNTYNKTHISKSFKLNLIIVLIVSLFTKLTIVPVINGGLSVFLVFKLLTHSFILFSFLKKHYICLQLLFILDVILFFTFILFEFLFLLYKFLLIILKHKRNESVGFISIWLMFLIAAIDLLILVIIAIVLENYRRPRERFHQLETKLITIMHNGRLLASSMCKSSSYLLGFVCNNLTENNSESSNNNFILANSSQTPTQNNLQLATLSFTNDVNNIASLTPRDENVSNLSEEEYVHYNNLKLNSNNTELLNKLFTVENQHPINTKEKYLNSTFADNCNNVHEQSPIIVSNLNQSCLKNNTFLDNNSEQSVYVRMYQSNVDEFGDPIDGPLHCTRSTIIDTTNTDTSTQASTSNVNTCESNAFYNAAHLTKNQPKNRSEKILINIHDSKSVYI